MQLYARSQNKTLITASHATKGVDYFCLECGSPVRLRGGRYRRSHFFHVSSHSSCRQSGKTMVHLQVQCAIQEAIAADDVYLEKRFDAISRIADVVWEKERLVFEVQCSPISALEVRERNRDYERLGYRVVWILHDMRYNRWRLTAAEEYLLKHPHYFTNIDAEGVGIIYDQYAVIHGGVRGKRLPKLSIDIATPLKFDSIDAHKTLKIRAALWHTFFRGDLVDTVLLGERAEIIHAFDALKKDASCPSPNNPLVSLAGLFLKKFTLVYKSLFRMFLERASKR